MLQGGDGGTEVGDACLGGYAGGDVTIFAQQTTGPIDGISLPGMGAPVGAKRIEVDPTYTRDVPDIQVSPVGWVVSKVIDRGAQAAGDTPRLLEARQGTPAGTFVKIQLAGGDDPDALFDVWYDAAVDSPDALAPLAGARYLRYRVWLKGRTLDTPVIDGFDLALTAN